MPAYLIGYSGEVTNPEAMARYQEMANKAQQKFVARPLAHGGRWEVLEGDWRPDSPITIVEFADYESAKQAFHDEAYQAARALREGACNPRIVLVEGVKPEGESE
jgi:uncharacterized protein (DUF1330 family)